MRSSLSLGGVIVQTYQHVIAKYRVWKGILGIRDLTEIRCGIRENAKYLEGNRDLTDLWEAGFAKIWARDAGFFVCLSGIREIVTTQINVLAA